MEGRDMQQFVGDAGEDNEAKRQRVMINGDIAGTSFMPLDLLEAAFAKRWVSEWEFNFYKENMERESLSDKQMEIKKRIDAKTQTCSTASQPLEAAKAVGKINDWEFNFMMDNLGRENLSEKQLGIKQKIEAKIRERSFPMGDRQAPKYTASINPEGPPQPTEHLTADMISTIEAAHQAKVITEWERKFILDIYEKEAGGQLSERQLQFKNEIEQKLQGGLSQIPDVSQLFGVSKEQLQQLQHGNVISEWELTFALDNFARQNVTEKQAAIVERIKCKMNGAGSPQRPAYSSAAASEGPIMGQNQQVDQALEMNKINTWEHKFYLDNMHKESLSEKQQRIKADIEKKMARPAQGSGNKGYSK